MLINTRGVSFFSLHFTSFTPPTPPPMAAPLYVTQSGRLWHAGLILIVTVGLPGEHTPPPPR